jgi:DNA mismatch endonuclease (patch repair protein)
MTDVFTPEKRSEVMGLIRGKDTKPEKIVRSYLHRSGFRFRLHKKGLPGKPDLWLRKYNAAVFVNGCYWHRHRGCKKASTPKQNRDFWLEKLTRNAVRDQENQAALRDYGIRVLIVWECQIDTIKGCERTLPKIEKWLVSKSRFREIPPQRQP